MKKTAILILLISVLFGCQQNPNSDSSNSDYKKVATYVCNCQEKKDLQEFVKNSIKNANNMSDEEMEDVVKQLRIDGTKIYCKQKPIWCYWNGNEWEVDWKRLKLDSCENIMDSY
jgi:hypothetical protein